MADKKLKLASLSTLREKDRGALLEEVAGLRKQLAHARFLHAQANYSATSDLKKMRRQIARIETILTEKAQRD